MAHRKWREINQQPSMLPGTAVPGSCLVSFHILLAILSTSTVHDIHSMLLGGNHGLGGIPILDVLHACHIIIILNSDDTEFLLGCHLSQGQNPNNTTTYRHACLILAACSLHQSMFSAEYERSGTCMVRSEVYLVIWRCTSMYTS